MLESLKIAFAMFSKIPVGYADWNKKYMKNAIIFFPVVGISIGLIFGVIYNIVDFLEFGNLAKGAILASVSFFITGGIHMDGFVDTIDAVSSYQSKERRLEILKDPHIGAFALIWGLVYIVLLTGFMSELTKESYVLIVFSFALSRSLSAYNALTMNYAKENSSLEEFTKYVESENVKYIIMAIGAVSALSMIICDVLGGFLSAIAVFIFSIEFRKFVDKNFGGLTGDLSGFFIQSTEFIILVCVILCERVVTLWF